jgi:hypothetical protein
MKHTYLAVAKFSSSTNVSIEEAEQSIKGGLEELGPDVQPEIVHDLVGRGIQCKVRNNLPRVFVHGKTYHSNISCPD